MLEREGCGGWCLGKWGAQLGSNAMTPAPRCPGQLNKHLIGKWAFTSTKKGQVLGQKRCRTKVARIYRIFILNFARILLQIFEDFSCFISWEMEVATKNSPRIPAIFQSKIPRQIRRKIHKHFLESRQGNRVAAQRDQRTKFTFERCTFV